MWKGNCSEFPIYLNKKISVQGQKNFDGTQHLRKQLALYLKGSLSKEYDKERKLKIPVHCRALSSL